MDLNPFLVPQKVAQETKKTVSEALDIQEATPEIRNGDIGENVTKTERIVDTLYRVFAPAHTHTHTHTHMHKWTHITCCQFTISAPAPVSMQLVQYVKSSHYLLYIDHVKRSLDIYSEQNEHVVQVVQKKWICEQLGPDIDYKYCKDMLKV